MQIIAIITVLTKGYLTLIYQDLGRLDKTVKLGEEALTGLRRLKGEEDPEGDGISRTRVYEAREVGGRYKARREVVRERHKITWARTPRYTLRDAKSGNCIQQSRTDKECVKRQCNFNYNRPDRPAASGNLAC